MVADPHVFVLVFAPVELSPVVVVLPAEPEVVSVVADPDVFVPVFAPAQLSPVVVFVVDLEVSEPGVVFVAVVSLADVAEPQPSVDIAVAFDVLVPLFPSVVEGDSSGRPKLLSFPNVDHYATFPNSVEVGG